MTKIILSYILLFSFSFSGEIVIKDFEYCENDIKETKTTINTVKHQDTKKMVYLSKKYKTEANKDMLEELSKYVVLSYGKGDKDFFIFADPQCKFCRAFAKGSMDHLDDGTYHIIFLPLNKHKDAKKMMAFIMDGKNNADRFNRFKNVLVDETFNASSFVKPRKEILEYTDKILALTNKNGIKATPTFYKADRESISKIAWTEFNEYMVDKF